MAGETATQNAPAGEPSLTGVYPEARKTEIAAAAKTRAMAQSPARVNKGAKASSVPPGGKPDADLRRARPDRRHRTKKKGGTRRHRPFPLL
jgi:hypothetical protein